MAGTEELLARLAAAVDAEDYDGAVTLLQELETVRPLSPSELVARGNYIQLGSAAEPPLQEAERAYGQALALDPGYVPALIALGWYHYGVMDDALRGRSYFERALQHVRELATDTLIGLVRCAEDLDGSAAALRLLHEPPAITDAEALRHEEARVLEDRPRDR